jgi:hypothetical protein
MRVPGLVDTLTIRDPATIAVLGADPRLDRAFAPLGPLVNRWIARRVRLDYSDRGRRLPATAARDDPVRDEAAATIRAAFATPASAEELAPLSRWLDDGRPPTLAPLVQDVIARRFGGNGTADAGSWRAARRLHRAVQATPPERFVWALQGGMEAIRRRLGGLVGEAPGGIHGVGIAAQNIHRGLVRMQALLREPGAAARLSPAAAAARCLPSPPRVLRQASAAGQGGAVAWRRGTLVVFALDAARPRAPGDATVFMAGGWSECPAAAWVRAMFETLWAEATAARSRGAP